ncbi:hypothetical protein C8F04DRAFT_1187141 [Mycena alexandri]|uniref:Secreted protein n=1 Tax=Mycena alexandri TaxID=1745969 RepID=A0AAD6SLP7_9AGAR|nr:hypothetical protein C8F04DRAFT_1187141 [Mycena alexandri]
MVKNGLLTCIFLVLQGLFCAQYLFDVLTSLCRISGDGQEQPTGSHLPHGARIEHFKPIAIMLSSSGHNMLKRHCGRRREQGPFPPSTTCSETDGSLVSLVENPEMSRSFAMLYYK